MENSPRQKVIDLLLKKYTSHGFVTEDEVFELASRENLSLFDINDVTTYLLDHGVIIGDSKTVFIKNKGRGVRRKHSDIFCRIEQEYTRLRHLLKYYNSVDALAENEWKILLPQARSNNEWAKRRLFDTSMQKIIPQIYKISQRLHVDFEELLQYSAFGVLRAIITFDETESQSFISYIATAVNFRIKRYILLAHHPVLTIPTQLRNTLLKIYPIVCEHYCNECANKESSLYCHNLQNSLQNMLCCSASEVEETLQFFEPLEQLDENTLITEPNFVEQLYNTELKTYVNELLSHLRPQEENVIRLRYGIDGEPMSFEAIAQQQSLTRQRIQQVEVRALEKLKHLALHVVKVQSML
jgi:RNA polymerase primary sigma factor